MQLNLHTRSIHQQTSPKLILQKTCAQTVRCTRIENPSEKKKKRKKSIQTLLSLMPKIGRKIIFWKRIYRIITKTNETDTKIQNIEPIVHRYTRTSHRLFLIVHKFTKIRSHKHSIFFFNFKSIFTRHSTQWLCFAVEYRTQSLGELYFTESSVFPSNSLASSLSRRKLKSNNSPKILVKLETTNWNENRGEPRSSRCLLLPRNE